MNEILIIIYLKYIDKTHKMIDCYEFEVIKRVFPLYCKTKCEMNFKKYYLLERKANWVYRSVKNIREAKSK